MVLRLLLSQAPCYSKNVGVGVRLFWQQSQLPAQHNALASALVGTTICGDVVADVADEGALGRLLQPPSPTADWASLPGELLSNVVRQGGACPQLAQTLGQVCPAWRAALTAEKAMWQELEFERLLPPPRICCTAVSRLSLPWVVRQAAEAGNVSASVLAGRFCLSQRLDADAKKHWQRAAKAGHPEACWRVGVGYYRGEMALQQDSEEALFWLQRAARALANPPEGCLMSEAACAAALQESAHILGVIHLDGDATKMDTTAAIRWFHIAAQRGCADAGRMLQSLFRSGQY